MHYFGQWEFFIAPSWRLWSVWYGSKYHTFIFPFPFSFILEQCLPCLKRGLGFHKCSREEVFLEWKLVIELPLLKHSPPGAFRSWFRHFGMGQWFYIMEPSGLVDWLQKVTYIIIERTLPVTYMDTEKYKGKVGLMVADVMRMRTVLKSHEEDRMPFQ